MDTANTAAAYDIQWGRILMPDHQRGSTMRFVRNFWDGNDSAMHMVPPGE